MAIYKALKPYNNIHQEMHAIIQEKMRDDGRQIEDDERKIKRIKRNFSRNSRGKTNLFFPSK